MTPQLCTAVAAVWRGSDRCCLPISPPSFPLPLTHLRLCSTAPEVPEGEVICLRSRKEEVASEPCGLNASVPNTTYTAIPEPFRPLQIGLHPLVPRGVFRDNDGRTQPTADVFPGCYVFLGWCRGWGRGYHYSHYSHPSVHSHHLSPGAWPPFCSAVGSRVVS